MPDTIHTAIDHLTSAALAPNLAERGGYIEAALLDIREARKDNLRELRERPSAPQPEQLDFVREPVQETLPPVLRDGDSGTIRTTVTVDREGMVRTPMDDEQAVQAVAAVAEPQEATDRRAPNQDWSQLDKAILFVLEEAGEKGMSNAELQARLEWEPEFVNRRIYYLSTKHPLVGRAGRGRYRWVDSGGGGGVALPGAPHPIPEDEPADEPQPLQSPPDDEQEDWDARWAQAQEAETAGVS